ncbi:hypothetical protein GCM10027056_15980 [Glaciibacter psychrotolerans]
MFTPTKTPTHTSVKREGLWKELSELAEQGGAFIPVLGVTKLGKTTLVKGVMQRGAHVYVPAQELTTGSSALWSRLATALEIPSSTTKGKVVGDKTKWGFFGKFGVTVPGFNAGAGSNVEGEHSLDKSTGANYEVELSTAVTEAMRLLAVAAEAKSDHPPVIVLDDFHFVTDTQTRRELLLALRPVMENDATLILASLPGREHDEAYDGTNLDGRLTPVMVPIWDREELREIATRGFATLKVTPQPGVVDKLIEQSYGSPQIMQQLCLNLCRLNNVNDDESGVGVLDSPDDWPRFFRQIKDSQSVKWLGLLGLGLTQRGNPRNRVELDDGRSFDGYQLILWAIHELGSPNKVAFTIVANKIAELLGRPVADLGAYALEQKAKNMNVVATREMKDALAKHTASTAEPSDDELDIELTTFSADEIEMAELIPQPVFEVSGDKAADMTLRIMNPLLAYALTWHPESFETPKK